MEEIPLPVGRGDNTQLLHAAVQGIGHTREDSLPDSFWMVVKGKFGENTIGGVAADGLWFGRESSDARAVREMDFGRAMHRGALWLAIEDGDAFEAVGPTFGLGE